MTTPNIGDTAPFFSLPSDSGKTISLLELKGKSVVLFFYPKDDTSGCTQEAIEFSNLKKEFDTLDVSVIGISPDSIEKHNKFKIKHNLKVDLVADEEKIILQAYGVWIEKSMYGRKYMGVERSTFLISPDGKILRTWCQVKAPGHAAEVLATIKAM